MANINDQEKREYIEKLVDISRKRSTYVGIDHAVFVISGHAVKVAEERMETMKRESQTVCSLEAEV